MVLNILSVSKYVAVNGTDKDQDSGSLCVLKKKAKGEKEINVRNEQITWHVDCTHPSPVNQNVPMKKCLEYDVRHRLEGFPAHKEVVFSSKRE